MNNEQLNEKLKELKIEDFIWFVYIGIIILSWYSNSLERKYFIFNDQISKEKYRKIIMIIFSILVIVYFYFLSDSYKSLKSLNQFDSKKKQDLVYSLTSNSNKWFNLSIYSTRRWRFKCRACIQLKKETLFLF